MFGHDGSMVFGGFFMHNLCRLSEIFPFVLEG